MENNIAIIASPTIITTDVHIPPPTFSRLPPDGHEFPPNFSESIIIAPVLKQSRVISLLKLQSTDEETKLVNR